MAATSDYFEIRVEVRVIKRHALPPKVAPPTEDDLVNLIREGRVRVELSGSRHPNKDGSLRDYRGKYMALRERSKFRRVLAFGLVEQMSEYLANRLNVHYCPNCLTVSVDHCQNCRT